MAAPRACSCFTREPSAAGGDMGGTLGDTGDMEGHWGLGDKTGGTLGTWGDTGDMEGYIGETLEG